MYNGLSQVYCIKPEGRIHKYKGLNKHTLLCFVHLVNSLPVCDDMIKFGFLHAGNFFTIFCHNCFAEILFQEYH